MKHTFTLLILFICLAANAQTGSLPTGPMVSKPFVVSKPMNPVVYNTSGTSNPQPNSHNRSQDIDFTLDYGLLDYYYNENVMDGNGYWYRDDQFSFVPINGSLPVDSDIFVKWAMVWYPTIIDIENNIYWPFNQYEPDRIQMTLDTIYLTFAHEKTSHQNDTLIISVWDYDEFRNINFDTGASGTLYGRITIVTDTSLIPAISSPHFNFADHYPFVPSSPIVIPAGKRFLIQVDYYGPLQDYFVLGSSRRNDCLTFCGANIPYIHATFNKDIANWNSLLGVRHIDAVNNVKGIYPSTIFHRDCNNNGLKDKTCEETSEQNLDIFPHITATIPNFFVAIHTPLYLDTICPGSVVQLSATAAGTNATPFSYTWQSSGNSLIGSDGGSNASLVTSNIPGTDTVIVTVTDINSNTVSDTLLIKTELYTGCTTLQVEAPAATGSGTGLQLSPNPAYTQVTLTALGFLPQWLAIYDISGGKVSEQKFTAQPDISQLSPGIYFIEARGAHGSARQKLIKQ